MMMMMMMMMMMTINHFHYLRAAFCQVSVFIIFTTTLQNTKRSRYVRAIQAAAPEVPVNNNLKIAPYFV
jgi:hypothetical protein